MKLNQNVHVNSEAGSEHRSLLLAEVVVLPGLYRDLTEASEIRLAIHLGECGKSDFVHRAHSSTFTRSFSKADGIREFSAAFSVVCKSRPVAAVVFEQPLLAIFPPVPLSRARFPVPLSLAFASCGRATSSLATNASEAYKGNWRNKLAEAFPAFFRVCLGEKRRRCRMQI